jgi:hypothetical protein
MPLRKVMQLIGLGSSSQQDILGIPMWPSTQSHGNIFLPNATNCRQAAQPKWHIFQWKLIAKV